MEVAPGAFHLRGALGRRRQREIFARCRFLMDGPVAAYVPVVRGGGKMHVRMLCLGRHWNGKTYRYEPIRSDFDGQPPPPIPDEFRALARRLARVRRHDARSGRLHHELLRRRGPDGPAPGQGRDRALARRGLPVVSVSIGDTARFLFGGTKRRDAVQTISLASGDAFVFGGPARLRYHGVSRILPGTSPPELGFDGRFNLTFRQYDVSCRRLVRHRVTSRGPVHEARGRRRH
jgi:alkylated DNA repair protein (DNA oxidative demethylase)